MVQMQISMLILNFSEKTSSTSKRMLQVFCCGLKNFLLFSNYMLVAQCTQCTHFHIYWYIWMPFIPQLSLTRFRLDKLHIMLFRWYENSVEETVRSRRGWGTKKNLYRRKYTNARDIRIEVCSNVNTQSFFSRKMFVNAKFRIVHFPHLLRKFLVLFPFVWIWSLNFMRLNW